MLGTILARLGPLDSEVWRGERERERERERDEGCSIVSLRLKMNLT